MENLSTTYTNTPVKGLVTDLDSALVSKDLWTYALNSNHSTHQGNMQFLTNEPSNYSCVSFPYDPIGFIRVLNNRWVVFSTDDVSSEIGIFDETNCTYETIINDTCLNFNKSSLIRGAFKENFDCTETIYWTDGGRNPRRRLTLTKVPYQYTLNDDECESKDYTKKLNCNELLLTPKLKIPCINVRLGSSGVLKNGTYQFGMAYTVNQQRVTEFYSVTSPEAIWSHNNIGQSLVVELNNLDREFPEYELIIVYTQKETTTVKRLGFFPTTTTKHNIISVDRPEYITIPIEEIVTKRPYYYAADDVVANDQYLLWSGVTTRPELNYQKTAMEIVTKWSLFQVPADYYAQGGNKRGYFRGEVYSFGIQWLYDNGEWSSAFHIPGRKPEGSETTLASGRDVYERTLENCEVDKEVRNFEIHDTSKKTRSFFVTNDCNETKLAEGEMSYWEGVDKYADNEVMFGDDRCTPIRHHKFPEECNAPRYQKGGKFINILGVKFENIQHPTDDKGKEIDSIVGYRIVRGDRQGNRSIIAKGVFKNLRSYKETLNQQGNDKEVLYPNYPFNDLRPDTFISGKQTYYKSRERDFEPLVDYKKDELTFYSPNTLFNKISLGDELILDTEESGDVLSYFEQVFNHPRSKVINNSVFWLALAVGAIDGVLSLYGKKCVTTVKHTGTVTTGAAGGTTTPLNPAIPMTYYQDCETLMHGLKLFNILDNSSMSGLEKVAKTALKVLQTAASVGYAVYFALNTAEEIIKTVEEFSPFRSYALQANSKVSLTNSVCVPRDKKRRHIDTYQYLYSGLNTIGDKTINNFRREESVYLKLNEGIDNPKVKDTSRNTLTDVNNCGTPFKSFKSKASMYYGTVKRRVPNQYGQLDSINYLDTGHCILNLDEKQATGITDRVYETDTIFGGDVFISKMAVKSSHQFFSQNIANSNYRDGTEYDYTMYRNVGFPRFWLDSTKYDIGELITVGKRPNRLPHNKFNFDCTPREGRNNNFKTDNKKGYFYLFNNGVLEFFVESEFNLDFRDYKNETQNFYSRSQTDLSQLFRSDKIDTPEEFTYDNSFSKQLVENAIFQQTLDYAPETDKCFTKYKNRIVYSLPAFKSQKSDSWLVYLTNNFYDFPLSDFGNLSAMQSIDNQQIMFLFDKSAPYVTIGRDELELDNSGTKVTIGDGGLFAREPRPLLYTDYHYGNSQSRWAFLNTQFGSFYPSQRQGRLFNYTGKMEEISRKGLHFWMKEYLPSKLLADFPDFKDKDNPLIGVGITSVFDNTDEKLYFCKKDYSVNPKYKDQITYDLTSNKFSFENRQIQLTDIDYFDDASWTISYSPKDEGFISWHSWIPSWTIQGETHFMTVKDKTVWKHNEETGSYCNFYGVDYPWTIEYLINNGPNVEILRSIEYFLDSGVYYQDGRHLHTILDQNFDELTIYNDEQHSSTLRLKIASKSILGRLDLPRLTNDGWEVEYSKEENKIRVNQFWDLVKDRGEFTHKNLPLWQVSPNGYTKEVENRAINLNKNQFQRKKFRYMWHKVRLTKRVSGNVKHIFKLAQAKQTQSPR